MSRVARAAVLPALLAALSGASGAAGAAGGVPHHRPVRAGEPQPAGPGRMVLPFDEYRFGADERRAIARARTLLVADCMRAHGFAATTPPVDPRDSPPAMPPNARRYGVVDVGVATRYGYHFPPDPGAVRRAAGYRQWLDGLPARERNAFEGPTGTGGCAAEADRRLRAGIHLADPGWFAPLDFRSRDRSATDPRVRAAVARWRACMSGRGMRYASPPEAIADPRWHLNSPAPSRLEVATATADVRCKRQVGLVAAWLAAEQELQRTMIRRRAVAFADLARGNARFVANAERVLARHRPVARRASPRR